MNVAIVEDTEEWLEKIRSETERILKEKGAFAEIECYASAKTFLETKKQYDIVFMDICIKDENGLKTTAEYKQCFPDSIVMLVTSYEEFYTEGYKVEAFRYIKKDKLKSELEEGLLHALLKLKRFVKININVFNQGTVWLRCKDIIYIESVKRKVVFHTKEADYITDEKITELACRLEQYGFFRCEKSFLVNLDWVYEVIPSKIGSTHEIQLKNGEKIPLGVKKRKELQEKLNKWRFMNLNR